MRLSRTSLFSGAGICALVIGSALAVPLQANAATSEPSIEVNNLNTFLNTGYANQDGFFNCDKGAVYPTPGLVVRSLHNNCEYHIYLQYPGGVHPFCVDHNSSRSNIGTEYQQPSSIQIGPGTSAC
jgi:hypothetical protein